MKQLLILFCLACGNAFAMSGAELVTKLQSTDASDILQGHAYVKGVTDSEATFVAAQKFSIASSNARKFSSSFFCLPDGVVTRKVIDTIRPKLEAETQTKQQRANVLVRRAMIETWPCTENP